MILTPFITCFISLIVVIISDEEFCQRDRKLLLGGVFNYDKVIFAYSWKEVNSIQLWLVWRFETNGITLTEMGKSESVDQVIPGVPLFRAGFGLNLKCSDEKCNKFKDLVFIFFQNNYKVFHYKNAKFEPLLEADQIPWSLKPKGDTSEWYFGSPDMVNINGIVFSPQKMQLFVVSNNAMYVTTINLLAKGLKWTKLAESKDFLNALGGFESGSDIIFNKNESPDNMIVKYDKNGKEMEKVSVWKYFNCDGVQSRQLFDASVEDDKVVRADKNRKLLTIIVSILVVVVLLTDVIVAVFWIIISKNK